MQSGRTQTAWRSHCIEKIEIRIVGGHREEVATLRQRTELWRSAEGPLELLNADLYVYVKKLPEIGERITRKD